MKENEKKKCFVIMPFSDPEGYEKGHFDTVYKYLFNLRVKMLVLRQSELIKVRMQVSLYLIF